MTNRRWIIPSAAMAACLFTGAATICADAGNVLAATSFSLCALLEIIIIYGSQ